MVRGKFQDPRVPRLEDPESTIRNLEGCTKNSRIPKPGFHYSEKYLGRGKPEKSQKLEKNPLR
jgi:hypothetical protein